MLKAMHPLFQERSAQRILVGRHEAANTCCGFCLMSVRQHDGNEVHKWYAVVVHNMLRVQSTPVYTD